MKKFIALSMLVLAMPLSMMAQDDDMYFVPKNKSAVKSAKQTYYVGSDRDVDEYNRRGNFTSTVTPTEDADDIISFDGLAGVYPDSIMASDTLMVETYPEAKTYKFVPTDDDDDLDYRYSRQLDRWYGVYDPWFYGPGYWGSHFYWHSPYYYYSPLYTYYDPWYDPWFYGPAYYGWGSWYGSMHHYWFGSPWYDPWYYGYGYGYGWGGGYIPAHRVNSYAGLPSKGQRTNRGSEQLRYGAAGTGRSNAFNNIAKRQEQNTAVQKAATTRLQGNRQFGVRSTESTQSQSYNSSQSTFSTPRSTGSSFSSGSSRSSGSFSGGGSSRGGGGFSNGHGGRR